MINSDIFSTQAEMEQAAKEQLKACLQQQGLWDDSADEEALEIRHYHCNHLGTPLALTNAAGEIVWQAQHDAWGNITEEYNPHNIRQDIRLPGQHHDRETGLYYNRHRYYDPALGAYINQDPMGLGSGEPNLFAYVKNPNQWIDPKGLWGDLASVPILNGGLPGNEAELNKIKVATENGANPYPPTGFEGTLSVELSGTVKGPGAGTSASTGVSIGKSREDCVPDICVYSSSCVLVGPGVAGSIGGNVSASNAPPSSGNTTSVGVYGAGGVLGKGSAQVTVNAENPGNATLGGGISVGAGGSAGTLVCEQNTVCARN